MRAGAPERLEALIRLALEEDIGTGDATTAATVPAGRRGEARIVAKAEGVVAGTAVIARVYAMLTGRRRSRSTPPTARASRPAISSPASMGPSRRSSPANGSS